MRGGAFLKGKEGFCPLEGEPKGSKRLLKVGFRKKSFLAGETGRFSKKPSLMGKSNANECNESSLSNCRVQLALSTKKDGMILEKD